MNLKLRQPDPRRWNIATKLQGAPTPMGSTTHQACAKTAITVKVGTRWRPLARILIVNSMPEVYARHAIYGTTITGLGKRRLSTPALKLTLVKNKILLKSNKNQSNSHYLRVHLRSWTLLSLIMTSLSSLLSSNAIWNAFPWWTKNEWNFQYLTTLRIKIKALSVYLHTQANEELNDLNRSTCIKT